jgi:hypothetical protein
MKNICHIFPDNYPNPPSMEELLFDVNELLSQHNDAHRIIQAINKIQCPYYRQAIAVQLPRTWHQLEQLQDERTGYDYGDCQWVLSWISVDADMRLIAKIAIKEQLVLEGLEQPENNIQTTIQPTKTKTIMPLFINKQEGTIYNNCTINYGVQPTAQQPVQEPAVETQPAIPSFFRTDCHAITTIERIWKEALQLPSKTKVIRCLQQHDHTDGYFHLNHLTYQRQAELLNEAQDKFVFNAKDFENANKH